MTYTVPVKLEEYHAEAAAARERERQAAEAKKGKA